MQAVRTDSRSVVRNGVPIFAALPNAPTDAEGPSLDLVNRLRD